jgi:hypothetical protein
VTLRPDEISNLTGVKQMTRFFAATAIVVCLAGLSFAATGAPKEEDRYWTESANAWAQLAYDTAHCHGDYDSYCARRNMSGEDWLLSRDANHLRR